MLQNEVGQEFDRACNSTKELHFDTLNDQIAEAKKILIRQNLENDENFTIDTDDDDEYERRLSSIVDAVHQRNELELNLGDFVVTRHSNLDHVHLVFHFVCERLASKAETALKASKSFADSEKVEPKKEQRNLFSADEMAKLTDGLRNVLQVCTEYDVTQLSVPVVFLNADSFADKEDSQLVRHMETLLKTVRTYLLQNTRSLRKALKTLQFIIPKHVGGGEGETLKKLLKTASAFKS